MKTSIRYAIEIYRETIESRRERSERERTVEGVI
jgi:hypothetical protein